MVAVEVAEAIIRSQATNVEAMVALAAAAIVDGMEIKVQANQVLTAREVAEDLQLLIVQAIKELLVEPAAVV